jgi:hypothetical protein
MVIEFECKQSPWGEYARTRYEARLSFKHGCFKVVYYGESFNEIIGAALGAVQAFLDGEIFERELWGDAPYSAKPMIQFGPMSSEIKNIIEMAIDLKTGGDYNKLTEFTQGEQQ